MATSGKRTDWFVEARFGMFIHWGLYSLAARHEWVRNRERLTAEEYEKYFRHFDPDLFNPKEWARAAKNAGMKYMVVGSKHHEGFCLWDSKHTDYKAPNTPCGKDLLRPLLDAFREEGLRTGVYYSLLDWHHPEFTVDRHHPQRDDEEFRRRAAGRDMRKYAEYVRRQTEELLTNYGPLEVLWYDFSYPGKDGKGRDDWESEKLVELIRRLAPDILLDNRLDLPGAADFVTPEQQHVAAWPTDEKGRRLVWEACQTFSGSWGYHREERSWRGVKQLLWTLVDTVSKGGNLLLNVGPTARGEFDARARKRLEGLGCWMKRHERAIRGCTASEFEPPPDCRYTQNGKRLYLHFMAWPFKRVHLTGLGGKIEYAQFLHDASEVSFDEKETEASAGRDLVLKLPLVEPNVEIPVVELFLK